MWVEMMASTRIIPLDGRPHGTIRQALGDSRGHWEGDTLVVETTNFDQATIIGASRDAKRLVERFTCIGPGIMQYEFTIEDPTIWTAPWTAVQTFRKSDADVFEYACHEGNYAMSNILAGARRAALAAEEAEKAPQVDVKTTRQRRVLPAERVNVLPGAAGIFSHQYVPASR